MCQMLSAAYHWLQTSEPLAMWLEGVALVAIFALELFEYKRQGRERKEDNKDNTERMRIAQSQANALVNSERAWVIAELVPICRMIGNHWHRPSGTGSWVHMSESECVDGRHLEHMLKFTNMGRTPAHILRYELSYACLDKGVTTFDGGSVAKQDSVRAFDHLLAASDWIDAPQIVDVNEYIKRRMPGIMKLDNTAVFDGWVEYLHVFSNSEVVRAPFCYVYKPSTSGLERVPEVAPKVG